MEQEESVKRLTSHLLFVQNENERKNLLIKELSSSKCKKDDLDAIQKAGLPGAILGDPSDIAVLQLRDREIKLELLEKSAENENNIAQIKVLKSDKDFLLELVARQRERLNSLKEDTEEIRKSNKTAKAAIDQYLCIISDLQKEILFYKKEIEIKETCLWELKKHENKNLASEVTENKIILETVDIIPEPQDLKDMKEAASKIKKMMIENKDLKAQLEICQKQVASVDCEQKLSRETILRLSKDRKLENEQRIASEIKLFKMMQDQEFLKQSKDQSDLEIECLQNQILEIKDVVTQVKMEDVKKSNIISRLMESKEPLTSFSKTSDPIEIFIVKADRIIKDFYSGKKSNPEDVVWVFKCFEKLLLYVKESDPQK